MAIEEAIKITVDTNAEDAANQLDKLNAELRETAAQYLKLNEAEKKSAFGKGLAAKMENLNTQVTTLTGGTDNLGKSITEVGRSLEAVGGDNIDETGKSAGIAETVTKRLNAQLRELKERLAGLKEGTPEFIELAKQAGELQDRIEGARNATKVFADDTQVLNGVIGSLSLITSGFGAVQGAMALFGGQSEELNKVLTRVNATMLILNSLQQIQANLQKDSAARILITTAAQKLYTIAVGESTGALKGFRLAMASIGVLAAVAGITALIYYLANLKTGLSDAEKEQLKFNEAVRASQLDLVKEKNEMQNLVNIAKDKNQSDINRQKAIKRINEIMPDYIGFITKENINTKEGTRLLKEYNKELTKRAFVTAAQERQVELGKELIDIDKKIIDLESYWGDIIDENKFKVGDRLVDTERSLQIQNILIEKRAPLLERQNLLNGELARLSGIITNNSVTFLEQYTKAEKVIAKVVEKFPKMKGDIDDIFKFVIDGNRRLSDEFDPVKNPRSFQNALKFDIAKEADAKMYQQYLAVITETNEAATDSEEQRLQREKDIFSARQELYAQTASVFSNLSQIVAVEGKGLTDTQKALALVQIGIDTARALSSALAATYGTTPEPIAAAIKYATIAANILATAGKIKQVLSSGNSSVVQAPAGVVNAPNPQQAVSTVGGTTNVNVNIDISERDLRKANLRAAERRRGATVVV